MATAKGPDAARSANAKKKAAPKTVKVSQATIDHIKKIGMAKALKEINMFATQGKGMGKEGAAMRAEGQKLLKGEYAEGVRRMYGDRRFAEATGTKKKSTPAKKKTSYGPDAARGSY